jgi:hypothetical protein
VRARREIMALGLMAKIEFVFSDLVSLEFYMPLDGPSILTVRLQSSPKFFGEVNPRPGNKPLFFYFYFYYFKWSWWR